MRYSIEPKDIGKNLSNKYGQKSFDSAKKSTTDAINTASKKAIQKSAERTGDKIDDKITSVSKRLSAEQHSKELHSKKFENDNDNHEADVPKE